MEWPKEFSDQIIIGNLDSNIAIVTLWTKKEKVAEKLDKNDYSIIGQLINIIKKSIRVSILNKYTHIVMKAKRNFRKSFRCYFFY